MMKRITFLTVTLVTPYCIQSMDTYPVPNAIITHKEQVEKIYNKTESFLQKFAPESQPSLNLLVDIIQRADALKNTITPRQLGFHYFSQPPLTNKFTTLFSQGSSPFHISILIGCLLDQYNKTLTDDPFKPLTSPTASQIGLHLQNKGVKKSLDDASMLGINIPKQTIDAWIVPINSSVGLSNFDTLLEIIAILIKKSSSAMEALARIIYHDELMGQTPTPLDKSQR